MSSDLACKIIDDIGSIKCSSDQTWKDDLQKIYIQAGIAKDQGVLTEAEFNLVRAAHFVTSNCKWAQQANSRGL